MKSLEKNKTLIIALVIFILAIIAYNVFLKPTQNTIDAGLATQGIGNDVVALNQSLQSATLDQSLFSSSSYRGLMDFSTVIPQQPTGRPNPFDIIGQ